MLRIAGRSFNKFKNLRRCIHSLGLKEGEEIEGFKVKKIVNISELHLSPVIELEHIKTGAQHLHLSRSDDNNNTFAIAFRTSPNDSTGLPHILEHTTLCGSKSYPVHDPFFKMLNRSLASFMNAMTGPDITMYPFSTPNIKDYYNLLNVYMDAVFKPLLRDEDFEQEGWRLEYENVGDASSEIVFRGVVFNEMKGVFADPQMILYQELLSKLLPTDTYSHCFGGEPLCIPNLTVKDLRKFHHKCYHPSNAKIISYGNLNLIALLKKLNYLNDFNKQKQVPSVSREKRWDKPKTVHIDCAPDPLGAATNKEKQCSIALAFLCGDATDVFETFSLSILSELLISGPTSVFHRALIEPGYGDGFTSCTGFEAHTRDTYFAVGLQGVASTQYQQISDEIQKAIKETINKGFESDHIEAILHRIELGFKCQSARFGLDMALNLLSPWNHGADPVEVLNISQLVNRLRKQLQNEPKYFQNLLDKFFLKNPHQLTMTMSPNPDYDKNKEEEENKILNEKVSKLDMNDKEELLKHGLKLLNEQNNRSQEDLSCLPTLTIKDLIEKPDEYKIYNKNISSRKLPIQICPQPTNGVIHFRALLDSKKLNDDLRINYLPLFLTVASRMGTQLNDYKKFDRKKQLYTSGLGISSHIVENINNLDEFMNSILLSSVCLERNVDKMMELWQELLTKVQFKDLERLETLIKSTSSELSNGIAYSGHNYAVLNASSLLSKSSLLREQISGLTFIQQMKKFASYNKQELEQVLVKLQEIADILFSSDIKFAVNSNAENENKIIESINNTFGEMKNTGFESLYDNNIINLNEVKLQEENLPLPVGYLGRSILTKVAFNTEDYAALKITAQLLSSLYLHREVREKGGAYGSRASVDSSGSFTLFSYRDPEANKNTRKIFDDFPEWLLNANNYTDTHINEAKLSIFQKVDAPIAPGDKGMNTFLQCMDLNILQKYRLALRNVNKEDVINVTSKYLVKPKSISTTYIGP